MRITFSPLLLGVVLSACYRYVPAVGVQPSAGDDVRLTLSADATERLTPVLGAKTTSLSGLILSDGVSDLALAVDRTFKDDGVAVVWSGDRVTIPRSAITLTERRVLDRKSTLLATGGAVLGATISAFVLSKYRSGAGGTGDGSVPPPPP